MTQAYSFPRKSRRCRHFDEDGSPINGDECRARKCYFAHPKDPEWATSISTSTSTSRFRPPPPLLDRRESLSSRSVDRSRDRSRERGRGYSPGSWSRSKERSKERDRGWDDVNRKREQERRKSLPRDSFASSREHVKDSAQTKYRRIDTAIPSEPAAQRKLTASTTSANAAPDPVQKRVSIDANANPPLRPPSVPPPLRLDTLEPSPAALASSSFSSQHSRKPRDQPLGSSSGGFIVPSLPSPAMVVSTSSSHSVGQSKRHDLDENRAPMIIKIPVLSNSPTQIAGNGVTSSATSVLPSNPALTVSAGATPVGTPNIVTPIKAATNDTMQLEIADVEMAPLDQTDDIPESMMDEVSSLIWDTLSPRPRPGTKAIPRQQQNQEQGQDVSQSSQQPALSLPLPPPLPPLPNFELAQTTSGLSQEAKFDLWNKNIKIIAEVLVHHNKDLKLTSDIDDLTRYASSSYFSSNSNSRFYDDREAKAYKKRIENDLAELTTARDTARQTIQKLYSVLTDSDMWPSPPVIKDMRKQNMRVGEYVKALVDVMNKVSEDLTDLRRSLDKNKKGKVRNKVQDVVKEQEQDPNMMDVDVEDSYAPVITPNAHQLAIMEINSSVSEAESVDPESDLNTRHFNQKLQYRVHTLSEQFDTLQSTLDETESAWLQEIQDLNSSLLSKHKSSLAKYRDSFETSTYISSVKASLNQLSNEATSISRKVDQSIQEETRLSEKIVKLEEERDKLRKGQKKFFEEELPELKKKFEEYDKERERDAKRVSVLEAALKAFEKRTPGLRASPTTEVAAAVPTTASTPMPPFTLKPGDQISSLHQDDSTSFQSSSSSQEPQSSIMNLLQPRIKNYIREQVKPIIESVKKQVETMVNSQREDMRVTTWAKMDLTYKVLDEIGKQVGVDMAAKNESASINEQEVRDGVDSSMDLDR